MSKPVLAAVIFIGLVLAAVVYSSLGLRQYTCEVCMEFQGRTNCATASGTTQEEAQRTATDTACATISAGMTESIQCSRTPPASVNWIE
ncbi:MAG: hypothetical protein OXN89_11320 [Bryobacterales bacterium]|nr:hypothetical protein [Bryobacterales bacterium]